MRQLFAIFLLAILIFAMPAKAEKYTCDPDFYTSWAEDVYTQSETAQSTAKAMAKQYNLGDAEAKDLMLSYITFNQLQKINCPVPDTLRNKLAVFLNNTANNNNEGRQECDADAFKGEAEAEYNVISANPDFKKAEGEVFQQVLMRISSQQTKDAFASRWQNDAAYRKETILSVMQVGLREMNRCENIFLPVTNTLNEVNQ